MTRNTVGRGLSTLASIAPATGPGVSAVRRLPPDEPAVRADRIFTGREIAGPPDGRTTEGHGSNTCFGPFGRADADCSVTVHPRLVPVSEGGTIEVSR